jgi:uncharacterized protein (TIGR01777 family)
MAKILITGGSGLLGSAISKLLIERGDIPVHLSRRENPRGPIKSFIWNVEKNYIDPLAFENIDSIIHLAGAGVRSARWSDAYKIEIINSRIKSAQLLYRYVNEHNVKIKSFIGASAVGYYGSEKSEDIFTEASPPGKDFLSEVCILWEKSYIPFAQKNTRTACVRLGIILDKNNGAFPPLAKLARFGFASAVAPGTQYFPWIHVDDAAQIFVQALHDESFVGPYNAVADDIVTNKYFSSKLAKSVNRFLWLPNIPQWLLRLVLGERSVALTSGLKISNQKLHHAKFNFKYGQLQNALQALEK